MIYEEDFLDRYEEHLKEEVRNLREQNEKLEQIAIFWFVIACVLAAGYMERGNPIPITILGIVGVVWTVRRFIKGD